LIDHDLRENVWILIKEIVTKKVIRVLRFNRMQGEGCRRKIPEVECDDHLGRGCDGRRSDMTILGPIRHAANEPPIVGNLSLWKGQAHFVDQMGNPRTADRTVAKKIARHFVEQIRSPERLIETQIGGTEQCIANRRADQDAGIEHRPNGGHTTPPTRTSPLPG